MIEIIKYGEFKPFSVQKKKNKIVLMHTSREVGSYLTSLKYRYNGNYDKIPNYIITKEGKILKLLNDSNFDILSVLSVLN